MLDYLEAGASGAVRALLHLPAARRAAAPPAGPPSPAGPSRSASPVDFGEEAALELCEKRDLEYMQPSNVALREAAEVGDRALALLSAQQGASCAGEAMDVAVERNDLEMVQILLRVWAAGPGYPDDADLDNWLLLARSCGNEELEAVFAAYGAEPPFWDEPAH